MTEEGSLRQRLASLREALAAAHASQAQTAAPTSSLQRITDLVSALLQQQATSFTPRPIAKPFKELYWLNFAP